eukprot:1323516-Prymnesium_polylepis.1
MFPIRPTTLEPPQTTRSFVGLCPTVRVAAHVWGVPDHIGSSVRRPCTLERRLNVCPALWHSRVL